MKLTVIVPAFNEATVIGSVIRDLKRELGRLGKYEIVVIDDGSSDNTGDVAKKASAEVIHHAINRGLGGALGTGLAYAKKNSAELVVTFDADGQHDPRNISAVISPIQKNLADVVIGSRTLEGGRFIPWDRRIVLWVGNLVTSLLFGIKTTDSQSGFRAFSKKAIRSITVKTQEMEVSSEFFSEIRSHKLRLQEVPIRVIYTPYSRKKGQSNLNAFAVLGRLLLLLVR